MDYKKLLAMLIALKYASKDIHYSVKGDSFYSDHLFADTLNGDIDTWVDDINEVCFLGELIKAPYSKEVLIQAVDYLPPYLDDTKRHFQNYMDLVKEVLTYIESNINNVSACEANLVGGIAQDLQQRFGLLWRRIQ